MLEIEKYVLYVGFIQPSGTRILMDVRHSFTRMKEEMLLLFVHKQYVAHSFNPLVPQGRILRERALESVAVMASYNHTCPVFLQAPSPS